MNDRPEWFAPKRYGMGAGLPIAWQGWALLAGFTAVIGLSIWLFGKDNPRALAIVLPAIAVLLIVTAKTTRGGWRWRWGDPD
jgi:hypothetical protein